MVGKKGYMKTLEAIIAVVVVLMVVVISLSFRTPEVYGVPPKVEAMQDSIFDSLQNENRSCVISEDGSCIGTILSEVIDIRFDSDYVICSEPGCVGEPVPEPQVDNVYVDSFVIQEHDGSNFDFRLFRLYIWYRPIDQ